MLLDGFNDDDELNEVLGLSVDVFIEEGDCIPVVGMAVTEGFDIVGFTVNVFIE
jgi:hypothetical protein